MTKLLTPDQAERLRTALASDDHDVRMAMLRELEDGGEPTRVPVTFEWRETPGGLGWSLHVTYRTPWPVMANTERAAVVRMVVSELEDLAETWTLTGGEL